jgi:hypothetical protein
MRFEQDLRPPVSQKSAAAALDIANRLDDRDLAIQICGGRRNIGIG